MTLCLFFRTTSPATPTGVVRSVREITDERGTCRSLNMEKNSGKGPTLSVPWSFCIQTVFPGTVNVRRVLFSGPLKETVTKTPRGTSYEVVPLRFSKYFFYFSEHLLRNLPK